MPDTDAIVFDKDGTLFDFAASWSGWAQHVIGRLAGDDAPSRARMSEAMAFDLQAGVFDKSSLVIAGTAEEVAGALSEVLELSEDDILNVMISTAKEAPQVPVPGVREALADLSTTHLLGIVTNDNEATARRHIDDLGVTQLFASIIGYDSGFGAKPTPGPLLGFCDKHGIAPSRLIMVGDSRHDLEAGRAAGATTVGVLTGVADAEDLSDLADVVLADVTHLPGWLQRIPGGKG